MTTPVTTAAVDGIDGRAAGRRRRWPLVAVVGVGLLTLVLLGLAVAAIRSGDRPAHVVSAQVGGRTAATLAVVDGIGRITVHSGATGDDLYRISTPTGSSEVPTVAQRDGEFQLGFAAAADQANAVPASVDIVLSSAVTWHLRLAGGADAAGIDLRGTSVSELDLASGLSTVEIWLPTPKATLVVRETGGVNQLALHRPVGVPVRLTVDGGAGSVSLDGSSRTGVAAGEQFTSPGWATATNRVDVVAIGGVSRVRIDHD